MTPDRQAVERAARRIMSHVRRDGCLYCVCGRLMIGNAAHESDCAWEELRAALDAETTTKGDAQGAMPRLLEAVRVLSVKREEKVSALAICVYVDKVSDAYSAYLRAAWRDARHTPPATKPEGCPMLDDVLTEADSLCSFLHYQHGTVVPMTAEQSARCLALSNKIRALRGA